jgi:hypothetical protein
MKVMNAQTIKRWTAPVAGLLTLVAVSSSSAALIAPGAGPSPLAGTANFGGTVVGDSTVGFIEPSSLFQGTLRTVVVQNGSGLLDFYYQLTNTSQLAPVNVPAGGGSDIFRVVVTGFNGFGTGAGDFLDMETVTNGLAGISGAGAFAVGTEDAVSADRLPIVSSNQAGFEFSPFLGSLDNVDSGETSQFLVIRTNTRIFGSVSTAIVSGFGTAFAPSFAPVAVPEPATLLAGLALGGYVAFRDLGRRRRQPLPAKA